MGWFSRKLKVQPPYDTLTVDQQRALYFLLEYFSTITAFDSNRDLRFGYMGPDAFMYVKKARRCFGLTEKEVELLRPHHQDIERLYTIIKGIDNQEVLDYMVNNCYNLVVSAAGTDCYEIAHKTLYAFWKRFGYTNGEIWDITQKYMYRTEI